VEVSVVVDGVAAFVEQPVVAAAEEKEVPSAGCGGHRRSDTRERAIAIASSLSAL
jgi:hypothetical protein